MGKAGRYLLGWEGKVFVLVMEEFQVVEGMAAIVILSVPVLVRAMIFPGTVVVLYQVMIQHVMVVRYHLVDEHGRETDCQE